MLLLGRLDQIITKVGMSQPNHVFGPLPIGFALEVEQPYS
jgi:hypothetical protein